METVDIIIKIAALFTAIGGIIAAIYGIFKWFDKQEKQTADIAALKAEIATLRELHIKDMESAQKREKAEIQDVKDELCVLSYAMLASLNGLMQLHCNGEVSKAYNRLEKHLNQKAHEQ